MTVRLCQGRFVVTVRGGNDFEHLCFSLASHPPGILSRELPRCRLCTLGPRHHADVCPLLGRCFPTLREHAAHAFRPSVATSPIEPSQTMIAPCVLEYSGTKSGQARKERICYCNGSVTEYQSGQTQVTRWASSACAARAF